MAERIVIKKRIELKRVWWDGVIEAICARFDSPRETTRRSVDKFKRRIQSPFTTYWYRHPALTEDDNRIAAAICECHGADAVCIATEKSLDVPLFHIAYNQTLDFEPCFRRGDGQSEKGTCRPVLEFRIAGRTLQFRSLSASLVIQGALFILAAVSYAVIAGLLLYSIPILLFFIREPLPVSIIATRHGHIGLALLCLLVAIAALFGNLTRRVVSSVRRWTRFSHMAKQRSCQKAKHE